MKLNVTALGFTLALVWGVGLFIMTWWVIALDGATGMPTPIAMVYRGYSISPLGSVIGLLWGLADGFVGGVVIAWLYNRLAR